MGEYITGDYLGDLGLLLLAIGAFSLLLCAAGAAVHAFMWARRMIRDYQLRARYGRRW